MFFTRWSDWARFKFDAYFSSNLPGVGIVRMSCNVGWSSLPGGQHWGRNIAISDCILLNIEKFSQILITCGNACYLITYYLRVLQSYLLSFQCFDMGTVYW